MNKELFLKICKLAETKPDDAHRLIQKWCDDRWKRGREHGLFIARYNPEEAETLYAEIAAESRKRNEEAGIFLEDLPARCPTCKRFFYGSDIDQHKREGCRP